MKHYRIVYPEIFILSNNTAVSISYTEPRIYDVPAGFRRPLGSWRCDMRVSRSALQKSAFFEGTATGANTDLKHRAPLGPQTKGNTEPCRVGNRSISPRRYDWYPRSTSTEPTLPAGDELRTISDGPTSPSPHLGSIQSVTAAHGFNSKDRVGWSNEGREVFAAWILVLLGAALALLLAASHQPSTSNLRLPQWSDPPVGAANWADDPSAGRDGNLGPAFGDHTARDPLPEQLRRH